MSALTRCSRFSSLLRRTHLCSRRTNVLSCSTWKTVLKDVRTPTKFVRSISHQPVLTRSYSVSTGEAVHEANAGEVVLETVSSQEKHDAKYSENYPASQFWKMYDFDNSFGTRNNFQWYCHEIYSRYSSRLEIHPAVFYGCMRHVDSTTSFTNQEIRLLARCFGIWNNRLSKDEKIKWMNYLNDRFFTLGVPVDEVYFNIILNNYLLHWIPFSPVDFLSKMEKLNVAPNGMTFERFVIAYCRNGDIKSASQVLEHMKTCDYPLSQRGYASLVYGNFLAGDKETAMQLFRESEQAGFELDTSSYAHVILGLAKIGDLEGVKQIVNEYQESFGPVSEAILCFLLERVSETGNKQMFDYFMELVTAEPHHFLNNIVEHLPSMMKQGNLDMAYQFYKGLSSNAKIPLLYKCAVLADIPMSQVLHYASCLKADGDKYASLINYYLSAMTLNMYDKAVEILPHMSTEVNNLRPQDFWPLIRYFDILQDLDGLKSILPYIQFESDTIGIYLTDAMESFGIDIQQYQQILKEHSKFTDGQINACLLKFCLRTKGMDAGLELAKSFEILEELHPNTKFLVRNRLTIDTWEKICEVIFSTVKMPMEDLEYVLRKVTSFKPDMEKFKTMLLEKGVKVRENGIPAALKKALSEEELSRITKKNIPYSQLSRLSYKELMKHEVDMGQAFVFKICLLDKAFYERDWRTFENTLNSMDESGINDIRIRIKMAVFYSMKPEKFNKCMESLNTLKSLRDTKISLSIASMISLVSNLCGNGHHEEAIQVLEDFDIGDQEGPTRKFYLPKIFNMEPTEDNIKLARRLLYALKGCMSNLRGKEIYPNYCRFISNLSDTNDLASELEMLQRDFKFSDISNIVVPTFRKVMATNDKMELQAIYDQFSQVVPEHSLLVYLAAAFLEAGHKDKARKVLATTGLRVQSKDAYDISNMWMAEHKVELVEDFIKLAELTPGSFTRVDTLFTQLKVLCTRPNPDVEACIQFYENKFDEEGLVPTHSQMAYFKRFLKKQNASEYPEYEEESAQKPTQKPTQEATRIPSQTTKVKSLRSDKTLAKWRQELKEQPDILNEILKSMDKLTTKSKTSLLTAAVLNGDMELGRKITKAVLPNVQAVLSLEDKKIVVHVGYTLRREKQSENNWYNYVSMMYGNTRALNAAINFIAKIDNHAAMEEVMAYAKEQDLTMEKIAENVKGTEAHDFFCYYIKVIRQLEDKYKTEGRNLLWEPTTTWNLELPSVEETSQIELQKKQTGDVSSDKTTDTNTDNVVVDSSSEVIQDTAVDISVEKEADIQDTATLINDTDSTNTNK